VVCRRQIARLSMTSLFACCKTRDRGAFPHALPAVPAQARHGLGLDWAESAPATVPRRDPVSRQAARGCLERQRRGKAGKQERQAVGRQGGGGDERGLHVAQRRNRAMRRRDSRCVLCGVRDGACLTGMRCAAAQEKQTKVGVGVVFKPTDKVGDEHLPGLFLGGRPYMTREGAFRLIQLRGVAGWRRPGAHGLSNRACLPRCEKWRDLARSHRTLTLFPPTTHIIRSLLLPPTSYVPHQSTAQLNKAYLYASHVFPPSCLPHPTFARDYLLF